MIGSQIGPYRVESELGSGGMGTVYLAEVTAETPVLEQGRRIALKIVHPHLLATPGFFKRFLQEAEAGKRIRHENVVRTYEVDATLHEDRQVNYMAMEYVEGRSLRRLLTDLQVVPESLLREVALQVAAGLAAIHSENIVHRDLKPENVLITGDHQVRIMDLGVAKLQEASIALTREGQFTGSLLYAAPEQCEGKNVGAPADLYALGVMLYELGTGTNPFRRDDAIGIIKAHISLDPRRASDVNPDLSAFFTQVIRKLLAKAPEDRFASAKEICEVLEQGEASAWWGEQEKHLHTVVAELPSIQVRRETGLHGRTAEMAALNKAWEQACEGHGNVIFLEGEAGLGKSRLVDSFMRQVATSETHVLYGSYPPSGGLGGLSDAIISKFGSAGMQEALSPYMQVTPSLIPAFTALIRHETAPTGTDPIQGDALHAVVCNIMRSLASEHPTLWIVEDLHFAPADSRHLLLSMARAVAPHRILLVATSRPGLPESEMANLSRVEHLKRITLGRLGARDVIELLQDAFKSEVLAEKLGGKIAYKSDGVPFFLFEMIRALKDGKFLAQTADGSYVQTQMITDIEVPSAVRDLIEARLKELSDDDRSLLDVAAVQGYEFDAGLIAAVRELKKVQVLERLAAIERRHNVIRSEAGTSRFDHYQLQEILYRDLMPELREEYHSLLADAFAEKEDLTPEDADGEESFYMARHHLRGSRPKRALAYLPRALDYLEGAYQNDAAIDLAQRALGVKRLLKGKERVDVLVRLAGRLDALGRREEQRAAVEEAVKMAEDATQKVAARVAQARYLDQTSQFAESLDCARDAAEAAGEDKRLQATVGYTYGIALYRAGRYEYAVAKFDEVIGLCKETGDTAGEWNAIGTSGVANWYLGRYAERMDCHERRLAGVKGKGGRPEAVSSHNLANVYSDLGRMEEARTLQERALRIAREAGVRELEAYASHELGKLAERRGEADVAAGFYREARVLFGDLADRDGMAEALIGLGRVDNELQHFDEALKLAREFGLHGKTQLAAAWRAKIVGKGAEEAIAILDEHAGSIARHEQIEGRYVLWLATGDVAHLAEAHRLLSHLRDHAPEEYRDSMIQNIPLNRDIMAAHEQHGEHGASA